MMNAAENLFLTFGNKRFHSRTSLMGVTHWETPHNVCPWVSQSVTLSRFIQQAYKLMMLLIFKIVTLNFLKVLFIQPTDNQNLDLI